MTQAPPAEQQASSPLAEAVPESLDELFSRDPLKLTELDLDKIIAKFRLDRQRWAIAEGNGAKSAPRAKAAPKAKVTGAEAAALDLSDLGLG